MFRKLSRQKQIGVICELLGFALLIFALILIPFRPAGSWKYTLLPVAAVLILIPIYFMWRDGLRSMREIPQRDTHWHRMRQSGFFDLLVLLTIIALILFICWAFGNVTYHDTLSRHAPGAVTLEAARSNPDFIEYNFKQDLNLIAANYQIFGWIALVFAVAILICALYMRFVSPIVRADEHLQIAHGVYRVVAQYAVCILLVIISLFPIYWMIISSLKTSDELLRAVPTVATAQ